MRTDQQRIETYDAKSNPVNVAPVVTAQLPTMKSGFATKVAGLVAVEIQMQAACNAAGVPTIQYPFYINYAREAWKLQTSGISGTTFTMMMQSLKDKYERYGLAEPNLIQWAADIFQVTVT